ncbi:DUF4179 domain-containing protein [Clostridium nigeriense]|uniref:DUF4179 domain-containing protein n=1 Tax=Clostridium nigeriense TaxID=1805470 RepID=UPI00082EBF63|nr:DUF4179 domain-containing protein [Clostridium nigeriense]
MKIDIDKKVENELKRDVEIPQSVLNKINNAFNEIRIEENEVTKSIFKFNKKLVVSFIAIFIIGTIIVNPKVIAGINSLFKDKGVQKAANNGYIQEVKENVVNNNGISIKIDDVVADQTKIAISFTFKFEDVDKLKNVAGMQLGLNVKDNNDRIIFEHLEEGIHTPYYIGMESNIDISNKDNGEIKYYLKMYSTDGQLKDVNSLSIKIDEIKLYEEDMRNNKKIEGEWNLSLNLDEKFINGESLKYNPINNNDIVNIVSAEAYPTGLLLQFTINSSIDENIINRVSIIDENGNEFDRFNSARMNTISNGGVEISMMFDLTTFDNLNEFKMIVKGVDNEDIVLDFIKEDK